MKVFVAGATGRVARLLIQELLEAGHIVYAGARQPEKLAIQHDSLVPLQLDLHAELSTLVDKLEGMDAAYFTAGSRGQDLLQTDAFGAVKLMQASQTAGLKRFILLSSLFATQPDKWGQPGLASLTDYNIAKFFADHWLINQTDLDYTILQPGGLTETEASGKVSFDVDKVGANSIGNVAKVLAQLLSAEHTIGKVITMLDGDLPIEQAVAEIK